MGCLVRRALIAAAIFLFMATQGGAASREPSVSQRPPIDLGTIATGSTSSFTLPIENNRSEKSSIVRTQSACESVRVVSCPVEVPPHSKGEVELRICPLKPAEINCTVSLETNSPDELSLTYTITGKAEGPSIANTANSREVHPDFIVRRVRAVDPSLLISADSVAGDLKTSRSLTIIDVRNSNEFARVRIPDSINIPLFAVKTKGFLKNRRMVLVNNGYGLQALLSECRGLRSAGFIVSVLEGGLSGWKGKGYKLEGDPPAQADLSRVPPEAFFEDKDLENFVALDATNRNGLAATRIAPWAIKLLSPDDTDKLILQLRETIATRKSTPLTSFLLFDDDGKEYTHLERALNKAGITGVLYLKGGIHEYLEFLTKETNRLEGSDLSAKVSRKCSSCP